ncbi:hypothetical protein [Methanohalobium sp.]|nr:hypothetical protein [Methanohalobium sp.]
MAWTSAADTGTYFIGSVLQRTGSPWELGGFPIEILISLRLSGS